MDEMSALLQSGLIPPGSPLAASLGMGPQQGPQQGPNPFAGGPQMQFNPMVGTSPMAQAVRAQQAAPANSPLQRQAAPPQVPGGTDLTQRYAAREAQLEAMQPLIKAGFEGQQRGYENLAQSQSALKDLLKQTQQRLGDLQYGPDQNEMMLRVGSAMSGPVGLGADLGRGAGAAAQGLQQRREGALLREELQAKHGISAAQADQMAQEYQLQASGSRLGYATQQANQANQGLDRIANQQQIAALRERQTDPGVQAVLAYVKAKEGMAGQLAAAGIGGEPPQAGPPQAGGAQSTVTPGAFQGASQSAPPGGPQPAPQGPPQAQQTDPLTHGYATYQIAMPPPPVNARGPAGLIAMQQYRQQYAKVLAENPDFQQGNKAIADKVRTSFDQKNGDNMRFLGNVAGHMETYDQLMQQAKAAGLRTDTPAFNLLLQRWATETGHPEITNLAGVQSFLGPEFAKVIVPSGATGPEREEREKNIRASLGPEQWDGLHGTLKTVLGTQLSGLEHQYKSSLYFMPKQLLDQEWGAKMGRPELQGIADAHNQRPAPNPQDIAYVRAHPEVAPLFRKRFNMEPPQ